MSRAETSAVTIRALILIGFILLFVNVCACAGVIYQKYRVRRRESRLREEVQVITELLVSEEQPQLALHVANAMKTSMLLDAFRTEASANIRHRSSAGVRLMSEFAARFFGVATR